MNKLRIISRVLVVGVAALAVVQLVPYGRNRAVPPDGTQVAFDSPRTESLARRACFDCHSNQTKWPWYASIAPVSWRLQNHVDEGRAALNFNALDSTSKEGAEAVEEAAETVKEGEMPPADYLLMHPEARLSPTEKSELARGLNATFATTGEEEGRGKGEATGEGEEEEEEEER